MNVWSKYTTFNENQGIGYGEAVFNLYRAIVGNLLPHLVHDARTIKKFNDFHADFKSLLAGIKNNTP